MNKRLLIGVIICESENIYQQRILKGIITQAYALNCDVAIFSTLTNFSNETPHQAAERNIFNLMQLDRFDGILYARTTFHNDPTLELIDDLLKSRPSLPVVVLDQTDTGYPYVMTDDRTAFERLVTHFIEEHGFTNIYCMTGFKGHKTAEERLLGYRQALEKHHIPYRESAAFYGDYWTESAEQLGWKLIHEEIPMPEAIVCANDVMAFTLCNLLTDNGIDVPGTVSIAGYDATVESRENLISITSYTRANFKLGTEAVCKLRELITGTASRVLAVDPPGILTGNSCTCGDDPNQLRIELRKVKSARFYESLFRTSNMPVLITMAETIDTCMSRIHGVTYLIRDMQDFFICLCDDWAGNCDVPQQNEYRRSGFPEMVTIKLAHTKQTPNLLNRQFPAEEMFPLLFADREKPCAYYFTPLHHNDRFFGYTVLSYGDKVDCYDEMFCRWCANVSTAIEFIRVQNYLKSFNHRIFLSSIRDSLTGIFNPEGFRQASIEKFKSAVSQHRALLIMVANIDNLKQINDTYGYLEGDNAIITFANAINNSFSSNECCARTAGDEFMTIGCNDYEEDAPERYTSAIESYLAHYNQTSFKPYKVEASIGFFCGYVAADATIDSLISLATSDLLENKNQRKTERNSPYYSEFVQLREKIYSSPSQDWNINAMCKELILSRGYFQKLYTRCFGISFTQDVINSRVELSKRLLSSTDLSIAMIADRSGYDNYVHFMHQFKKIVGITPTDYRKKKQIPK